MNNIRFIVSEDYEAERLDKYLSVLMPDLSRSYIQKIIKSETSVQVNGKNVKASHSLMVGDEVNITIPEPIIPEILPEDIPINIIYEDSDFLIINKDKDMVVHPAPGHYTGTLVNAVMYHCKDLSGINGVLRPGIVHRIDKDTTGLIIICKNDTCHNDIAAQLKEHSIERTYYALCHGNVKNDEGIINEPLGRDNNDRKKMTIKVGGKEAITHYKVLERFGDYTLIQCNLETGRTHQIRVHMSHLGYPLVGDEVYGHKNSKFKTNGQMLHAKTIGFVHPSTHEWVQFDSELPEYFLKILNNLRNK